MTTHQTTSTKPRWPSLVALAVEFDDALAIQNLARHMADLLDKAGSRYEGEPPFPDRTRQQRVCPKCGSIT